MNASFYQELKMLCYSSYELSSLQSTERTKTVYLFRDKELLCSAAVNCSFLNLFLEKILSCDEIKRKAGKLRNLVWVLCI